MTPWTTAQVRVVAACDLLAALVVAVAAHGAGQQGSLSGQVTWVDLGVVGLLLAVVANGSLFLAARRAVGRRRLDLLPDVIARVAARPEATPEATWWWLPGTTRAHVEGCQMISGKPAEPISADAVRANRLRRCEICP